MKILLPLSVLCALFGTVVPLVAQTTSAPKSDKEKLSYAIGLNVAMTFKTQGIDIDAAQFAAAVRDVTSGAQPQISEEQMRTILTAFSSEMRAKAQAAQATRQDPAIAQKNKKAGDDFLLANKAKPGVQVLPSGLQYKVLKEGSGAMPKASDTVTVKYRGTLTDGKEFDDSEKHGGTATFPVGGVIKGWTEALQKMKVGSKWQLAIPSEMAYGENPPSPEIPPASVLLFDVELVSIGK